MSLSSNLISLYLFTITYFSDVVVRNRYRGQYNLYRKKLRVLENEAACLKEQADTISTSSIGPVDLTNPVVPGKYITEDMSQCS